MKTKAIFYHAGCPVCVEAEHQLTTALDPLQFDVEIVHFGEQADRIAEAERFGVKSVPALVLGAAVFHVNYGASMADVKG
ncbi:hypothetical protein SAMN04515617_11564 [Collimonas sp. OK242]|jgi:predicted DsbA family dithiol-disulfide isomerase|uniref:hypothetical protein n=1 Tax=Collimonas sp. OK242 TaxID=1798195 RepID=UPI00089B418A|nr:hypothetical protein [Collimonas sp. OK242]SDY49795.1 hypothetical protein SAMN04515617_11564 [Collimonas sp. OK242]